LQIVKGRERAGRDSSGSIRAVQLIPTNRIEPVVRLADQNRSSTNRERQKYTREKRSPQMYLSDESYSSLSARSGSILDARRAGINAALAATDNSVTLAMRYASRSVGVTPNSIFARVRVTPIAASTPSATPPPTRRPASERTVLMIDRRW